MLHIQQKHSGCIGVIGAERSGQLVCQIILRQHDLADLRKILRLVFLHPEDLRSGKTCKRNICRILGQFVFSDLIVQVIGLLLGTAVVPQDRRADHMVFAVQDHQSVHLSAEADACHLRLVKAFGQFLDTFFALLPPVFRFLLRPARMRERKRIFAGYNIHDFSGTVH